MGSILESFKAGAALPTTLDPIFAFQAHQVTYLASLKFFVLLLLLTVSATSFSLCARLLVCDPSPLPLLLPPDVSLLFSPIHQLIYFLSAPSSSDLYLLVIENGEGGPEKSSITAGAGRCTQALRWQ